jgi:hypothetical protein
MNDPFYNLYHILIDVCKNNNYNISFEIYPNLGENNPANFGDPTFKYDLFGDMYPNLTKSKILFHDQEPILFSEFKKQWLYKIYMLNRFNPSHILSNSEKNSVDKDTLLATSGWADFYWFSNGFLSLEWYRFYKHASYFENNWRPTKIFSSYNRILKNREHRLIIAKHLLDNFLDKSIVSCHNVDVDVFHNVDETISQNYSYTISPKDFINSFCHLVTERIFYEKRIHLTEKVFRPIICCRPFILISSPGALKYLKDYGFKTFNDFWPEDYDDILDHNERLKRILEIIDYIGNLSEFEIHQMLDKMKEILLYNRNYFYNGFEKTIRDEMIINLEKALKHNKTKEPLMFDKFINNLNQNDINYINQSIITDIESYNSKEFQNFEFKILHDIFNNTQKKYLASEIENNITVFKYYYDLYRSQHP